MGGAACQAHLAGTAQLCPARAQGSAGALPAQEALCKSGLGTAGPGQLPGQPHSTGSFSHWPAAFLKGMCVGSSNQGFI